MVGFRGRRWTVGGIPTPPQPEENFPWPITKLTIVEPTVLSKPAYLQSVEDNMFGTHVTKITRVSTSSTESPTYFPSNTGNYVFDHGYYTRQPWSKNGTWLRIGTRILANGTTYVPVKYMDSSYKLWSNTNDNVMYHFYSAGYARRYFADTQTYEAGNAFDIRGLSGIDGSPAMTVGNYEGNLSMDDSRLIVCANFSGVQRIILVNPLTGAIFWNKSLTDINTGVEGLNNISVTKSGLYFITNRNLAGSPKQSFLTSTGALVNADLGLYSHRENQYGFDGREYHLGTNPPTMHDVITGEKTTLVSFDKMAEIFQKSGGSNQVSGGFGSGRVEIDGWMMHCSSSDSARYMETFFVKMDGSGDVARVMNARMLGDTPVGPQGAPSRDAKRVLFISNWNTIGGPIDAYVAERF